MKQEHSQEFLLVFQSSSTTKKLSFVFFSIEYCVWEMRFIEHVLTELFFYFYQEKRNSSNIKLLDFCLGWAEKSVTIIPFVSCKTFTSRNEHIRITNTNYNIVERYVWNTHSLTENCSSYWNTSLICPCWNIWNGIIIWCCEIATPKYMSNRRWIKWYRNTYQIVTNAPAPGTAEVPT